MRKFSLDYPDALALARESRPLVSPNPGFEDQLQIWHSCGYNIYLSNDSPAAESPALEEKDIYKAWKSNRDIMVGIERAEEAIIKARLASIATMSAKFGRREFKRIKEERAQNWKAERAQRRERRRS